MSYQRKKDKYYIARGSYSRLIIIFCAQCGSEVTDYQKDGAGPLKRLYADRIVDPKIVWKNDIKLKCKKCKTWLGLGAIYKKEDRKCFILFQDVVKKEIKKYE